MEQTRSTCRYVRWNGKLVDPPGKCNPYEWTHFTWSDLPDMPDSDTFMGNYVLSILSRTDFALV